MKKHFLFFIISFIAVFAATYLAAAWIGGSTEAGDVDHEAWHQLHREAELVEHFCLSAYPTVYGRATIPGEWERALKSTIRLREGVGEIASEGPELKKRADEIRALQPGQSVQLTAGKGADRRHMLVYKTSAASGQFLLFLAKNETDLQRGPNSDDIHPWGTAALTALAAALVLTLAARFIWPPQ
jgi:hypothetical protein